MSQNKTITDIKVRDVEFKLNTFNRSLELCARMNYEVENLDFIDQLEPNSVMFDLGACEGRFSIYAALKGHKVYSFEPNKANFDVFEKNIKINQLEKKITLFNIGVGEFNKNGILQIGQPWPGGHQKVVQHKDVRSDLDFKFVDSETIEIVSLDDFITVKELETPSALKIDIDGSEVPFMKGAFKTLESTGLRKIIFELDKNDNNYEWIVNSLHKAGFKIKETYAVPNETSLYNVIFEK